MLFSLLKKWKKGQKIKIKIIQIQFAFGWKIVGLFSDCSLAVGYLLKLYFKVWVIGYLLKLYCKVWAIFFIRKSLGLGWLVFWAFIFPLSAAGRLIFLEIPLLWNQIIVSVSPSVLSVWFQVSVWLPCFPLYNIPSFLKLRTHYYLKLRQYLHSILEDFLSNFDFISAA